MSMLISCTNFGDCRVAGDGSAPGKEIWGEGLVACPYCGKSLVSPHLVTIEPIARTIGQGDGVSIVVRAELGNRCPTPARLWLEIDGEQSGGVQDVAMDSKDYTFDPSDLAPGIHRIWAVLKTGDGRRTLSNEQLLLVAQPSNLIAPLLWALLLFLLLCLGSSLGWFSKFSGWLHPWASTAVDGISAISGLLIGGLLLDLGRREKAQPGVALAGLQPLSGPFPRSNAILNKTGRAASSGNALIVIGALPFCIALACLGDLVVGNRSASAFFIVFIFACLAIGAVVWFAELKEMGSRFGIGRRPSVPALPVPAAAAIAPVSVPPSSPLGSDPPSEAGARPEGGKP